MRGSLWGLLVRGLLVPTWVPRTASRAGGLGLLVPAWVPRALAAPAWAPRALFFSCHLFGRLLPCCTSKGAAHARACCTCKGPLLPAVCHPCVLAARAVRCPLCAVHVCRPRVPSLHMRAGLACHPPSAVCRSLVACLPSTVRSLPLFTFYLRAVCRPLASLPLPAHSLPPLAAVCRPLAASARPLAASARALCAAHSLPLPACCPLCAVHLLPACRPLLPSAFCRLLVAGAHLGRLLRGSGWITTWFLSPPPPVNECNGVTGKGGGGREALQKEAETCACSFRRCVCAYVCMLVNPFE